MWKWLHVIFNRMMLWSRKLSEFISEHSQCKTENGLYWELQALAFLLAAQMQVHYEPVLGI